MNASDNAVDHSPLPWTAAMPEDSNGYWYVSEPGDDFGQVCTCYVEGVAEGNAKLIAHCVNLHGELVAALRVARNEMRLSNVDPLGRQRPNTILARALVIVDGAIAKAEGRP